MSRNYKFHNKEGIYFVSFATVFWIDVFVRRAYFDYIVENLNICIGHSYFFEELSTGYFPIIG